MPWLTNRGHLEPVLRERASQSMLGVLEEIFVELGGDADALSRKAGMRLRPDFLMGTADQIVELDEAQHFTSSRQSTLERYPVALPLGFDLAEYRDLCGTLSAGADKNFGHRQAVEFPGPGGRRRQRAFFDALRDFAAPLCGHGPVIRIPAPERDPHLAAERLRVALAR